MACALRERAGAAQIEVVHLARPEVDLTKQQNLIPLISATRPDIVINTAAYTAVDQAENEPGLARTINCIGAGAVATASAHLGLPIIHLSTDYVFGGTLDRAYREDDPVDPKNVYGQTKRDGETAVAIANANHVIIRTSWIHSPFGTNFVRTMLSLAQTRSSISVVNDQHGTPTSALDVAAGILALASKLLESPSHQSHGIFHMTSQGSTTWATFAEAIFDASYKLGGPAAHVIPIATASHASRSQRPLNSCLDNSKLRAQFGIQLPDWKLSLPATVRRLIEKGI
jgi:dTDP-4-dehydrorhamnose reductase